MRFPRPSADAICRGAVYLFGLGMLLGATLCAGCATFGTTVVPRVGQEQAVDIVWHQVYGRSDLAPLVRWKEGDQLDCMQDSGVKGFTAANFDPSSPDGPIEAVCRGGLTMSPLEVIVAWHGELSFSETTLAHELMHADLARRFIIDEDHVREEWQHVCAAGAGPRCGLVDKANAALIAAGR